MGTAVAATMAAPTSFTGLLAMAQEDWMSTDQKNHTLDLSQSSNAINGKDLEAHQRVHWKHHIKGVTLQLRFWQSFQIDLKQYLTYLNTKLESLDWLLSS